MKKSWIKGQKNINALSYFPLMNELMNALRLQKRMNQPIFKNAYHFH